MNWVDLITIILLLIFTLEGLGRNFVSELLDFLSFAIALAAAFNFYGSLANFFNSSFKVGHSLANILGFTLLWFITESFLGLLLPLIYLRLKLPTNPRFFFPLGLIPAFFRSLIFVAIILVVLGTFPIQPKIKQAIVDSKIASQILAKTQSLEQPLKNVFGGVSQDSLSFLTVKPQGEERIDLGFKTTNFSPSEQLENQMIVLVNNERVSRGLNSLKFDPKLREIAREHSGDMLTRGYFSHYSPEGKNVADRAEKAHIDYLVIGENLAYAPNLELAHNGLMNSPGHRANILSADYNKIGIGVMDAGVYGLMVTQVFTN